MSITSTDPTSKRRLMRTALKVSVAANLLLGGLVSYVFVSQGGVDFLVAKGFEIIDGSPYTEAGRPFSESGLYRRETSIFERLPIRTGDVVFAGDEQVAGAPWTEIFSTVRVRNRGIDGETTDALALRLDALVAAQPSALFLSIGRHDLRSTLSSKSPADVAYTVRRMVESARSRAPRTEVVLLSALPQGVGAAPDTLIAALNKEYQNLATALDITFIDTAALLASSELHSRNVVPDGVPLGAAEYARILEVVRPLVMAALERPYLPVSAGNSMSYQASAPEQ